MTITCTGCGTSGEQEHRQEVGRTNPMNPDTGQRWWSRRNPAGAMEYACTAECKTKVLRGETV